VPISPCTKTKKRYSNISIFIANSVAFFSKIFSPFQVFIRRIVQLRAELEDGRDLVLALCKNYLPSRQWRLMAEDLQGDDKDRDDSDEDDNDNDGFGRRGVLNGFDVDPSVRFFGIDWESVFGRCFSLSLNAKIFGDQILDAAITFSTATQEQQMSNGGSFRESSSSIRRRRSHRHINNNVCRQNRRQKCRKVEASVTQIRIQRAAPNLAKLSNTRRTKRRIWTNCRQDLCRQPSTTSTECIESTTAAVETVWRTKAIRVGTNRKSCLRPPCWSQPQTNEGALQPSPSPQQRQHLPAQNCLHNNNSNNNRERRKLPSFRMSRRC